MSLLNWWKRPYVRRPIEVDPDVEREKRALLSELAQSVVTFEKKRDDVRELATVTLSIINRGKRR